MMVLTQLVVVAGWDLLEEGQILEITQASKVCCPTSDSPKCFFFVLAGSPEGNMGGFSVAAHSVNTEQFHREENGKGSKKN